MCGRYPDKEWGESNVDMVQERQFLDNYIAVMQSHENQLIQAKRKSFKSP